MKNIEDIKIKKLPIWAQNYIKSLISTNDDLDKKLKEIMGRNSSNVNIINGLKKHPLPKDSQIEFEMPNKDKIKIYIMDDYLQIFSYDIMEIISEAANSIRIKSKM